MGAAATDIITVEQFETMELPPVCEWWLVQGTVVSVTFPRHPHTRVQRNLQELLRSALHGDAAVYVELPYALSDVDEYCADVAVLSKDRDDVAAQTGVILNGAPELVVEVLSRSNVLYKVDEIEKRCLNEGSVQFWQIHLKKRIISVAEQAADGRVRKTDYGSGDVIPFTLFGTKATLRVKDIFAGIAPDSGN